MKFMVEACNGRVSVEVHCDLGQKKKKKKKKSEKGGGERGGGGGGKKKTTNRQIQHNAQLIIA